MYETKDVINKFCALCLRYGFHLGKSGMRKARKNLKLWNEQNFIKKKL